MNAKRIKYISANVKEDIVPVLIHETDVDTGEQYTYTAYATEEDAEAGNVVTLSGRHAHEMLANAQEVIIDENGQPMTLQQLVENGTVEEVETLEEGDGTHTILHIVQPGTIRNHHQLQHENEVDEDDEICETICDEDDEDAHVVEDDEEDDEEDDNDGIRAIYHQQGATIYETTNELVNTEDSPSGSGGGSRLKSFYCPNCGNCYSAAGSLKLHMRACMRQRNDVPQEDRKCNICNKVFNSVGYLKEHMLRHTGEQPFRCTRCYRKFVDENKYKTHVEAHKHQDRLEAEAEAITAQHGGKKVVVKEFNCSFCLENFTVVFEAGHVKRRYACDACREKYSNEEALRQHKALVEEKREFSCERCGRKFVFEGFLQRHFPNCDGSIKRRRDLK